MVLSLHDNVLTSGWTQLQLRKSDGEASPLYFLPLPFPCDSEWGHFNLPVSRWSVSSIKVESASVLTAATLPVIMPFVLGPCPHPGEYSSGFQKAPIYSNSRRAAVVIKAGVSEQVGSEVSPHPGGTLSRLGH